MANAHDGARLSRLGRRCVFRFVPDARPGESSSGPSDRLTGEALWLHYRAIALVDLRLPLEDFWILSPRELEAFHRRHDQAREHQELMFGILASVVVNCGFNPPKKQVQPGDFGLGPRKFQRSRKIITLSDEELASQWRGFFRGIGIAPKPAEAAKCR